MRPFRAAGTLQNQPQQLSLMVLAYGSRGMTQADPLRGAVVPERVAPAGPNTAMTRVTESYADERT